MRMKRRRQADEANSRFSQFWEIAYLQEIALESIKLPQRF